ncbi:NAD(P)-binding domain-containing protein [Mycobacteroides franklinii]|uniref:NAD(P)-binding domain-containing protein n=1 Tax=Mycobacteroides franklinii TaxID=948102 RepID=UPI0013E8DF6A|nr:NADP oxidoreductase [Mycobacteroides franklinii]
MADSVGIIGAGPVAQGIARRCVAAGIPVLLSNSRGPETLSDIVGELGAEAKAVTVDRAVEADLVVLAVPFVKVPDAVSDIPSWDGKVVIDATNQFAHYEPTYSGRVDLGDETGSEWVARHVPGAIVIKAFNAMYASYIAADPHHHDGRQVLFYAGDDDDANVEFGEFADALGFAPVLVGGLRDGGRLIQLDGPLSALHVLKQD